MVEHPVRLFHEETCYRRETMEGRGLDWRAKPPTYKSYKHAPLIPLPAPAAVSAETPSSDFWTCVLHRRSVRSFAPIPLTLLDVSRLLWASAGVTASFVTPGGRDFLRAAPSAGGLYPIETYLIVNKVEGLAPGLYHYRVAGTDILGSPVVDGGHLLEQLRTGDLRAEITAAALDQPMCGRAGTVFVWTAVFARSEWKYRERAYRYIYLDAGHVAAQLTLAVVAQGLAGCPVAAFYDSEVNELLGVDGRSEAAIYLMAVGTPSRPAPGSQLTRWD